MNSSSTLPRICKTLLSSSLSIIKNSGQVRHSKLWEPTYLQLLETMTPQYDAVNIQIKGYDFPILESFQKLINKIATTLELEVEDSWAVPPQHIRVDKFKTNSSVIDATYNLKVYERTVQVIDVKSDILPILIDAVITACPEGVTVNVVEHTPEMDEVRYVPDLELLKLKGTLEEMGGPSKKKK